MVAALRVIVSVHRYAGNGHKLLEDQLYSVTVTEGIFAALTSAFGLPVQDVETP